MHCWGVILTNSDLLDIPGPVVDVMNGTTTFAALTEAGGLYLWSGASLHSDELSLRLRTSTAKVFLSPTSFAGLAQDSSIVIHPDSGSYGRVWSKLPHGWHAGPSSYKIVSNQGAFLATSSTGASVVWGRHEWGGSISDACGSLNNDGVRSVAKTNQAFAVVTHSNTVCSWGTISASGIPAGIQGQVGSVRGAASSFIVGVQSNGVSWWPQNQHWIDTTLSKESCRIDEEPASIVGLSDGFVLMFNNRPPFAAFTPGISPPPLDDSLRSACCRRDGWHVCWRGRVAPACAHRRASNLRASSASRELRTTTLRPPRVPAHTTSLELVH